MTTVLQDVVDTAKRAVDTFYDRANGGFDFSEGSLSIVDEMLAEASGYIAEMPQSEISSLVQLLGCYVLEVAVRRMVANTRGSTRRKGRCLLSASLQRTLPSLPGPKYAGV